MERQMTIISRTWNRKTNEVSVNKIVVGKADNLISAKTVAERYVASIRV